MTKEEAKQWAELFTAYVEGKTIQIKHYIHCGGGEDTWEWEDVDGAGIDSQRCLSYYRIKPQQKIRPFANAKECWSKMLEHYPVGWVKVADKDYYYLITDVKDDCVFFGEERVNYEQLLSLYVFCDDDICGVEE